MSRYRYPLLPIDTANKIYDILVKVCGANEGHHVRDCGEGYGRIGSERFSFLYHYCENDDDYGPPTEWRFQGHLGYGGKFWYANNNFYVNYYNEDEESPRNDMMNAANKLLSEVYKEFREKEK